jgi:hypothetical protein
VCSKYPRWVAVSLVSTPWVAATERLSQFGSVCFFTKLLPHSASREHVFLSLHPSDNLYLFVFTKLLPHSLLAKCLPSLHPSDTLYLFVFTELLPHSASREHVFLSLHPSDNYGTTSGSAGAEVAGGVSDNWLDTLHQRMWTSFTSAD